MAARQLRPIRIEGNLAYVPLTRGLEAVIDAADVPLVEGFNWHARLDDGIFYAARKGPRREGHKTILMHRELIGASPGLLVDHADSDGLNNQRCNLRSATPSQNSQNRRRAKNNKSGFKGVRPVPFSEKWQAIITARGAVRYLGTFATAQEASAAYAKASAELHGEFGRLG